MAVQMSFRMEGMADLQKRLDALANDIGAKAIKGALSKTAGQVKRDMEAVSPPPDPTPGNEVHIKDEWQVGKSRRKSRKGKLVYTVGIRYRKDVAFLQKTKRISARAKVKEVKGTRYAKESRGAFYWKFREFGSEHQGAKPFVRPAFAGKVRSYVQLFEKNMADAVKKWERKVAKGVKK